MVLNLDINLGCAPDVASVAGLALRVSSCFAVGADDGLVDGDAILCMRQGGFLRFKRRSQPENSLLAFRVGGRDIVEGDGFGVLDLLD